MPLLLATRVKTLITRVKAKESTQVRTRTSLTGILSKIFQSRFRCLLYASSFYHWIWPAAPCPSEHTRRSPHPPTTFYFPLPPPPLSPPPQSMAYSFIGVTFLHPSPFSFCLTVTFDFYAFCMPPLSLSWLRWQPLVHLGESLLLGASHLPPFYLIPHSPPSSPFFYPPSSPSLFPLPLPPPSSPSLSNLLCLQSFHLSLSLA